MLKCLLWLYLLHLVHGGSFQWNRLTPRVPRRYRGRRLSDQQAAPSVNVPVSRDQLALRLPGGDYNPVNTVGAPPASGQGVPVSRDQLSLSLPGGNFPPVNTAGTFPASDSGAPEDRGRSTGQAAARTYSTSSSPADSQTSAFPSAKTSQFSNGGVGSFSSPSQNNQYSGLLGGSAINSFLNSDGSNDFGSFSSTKSSQNFPAQNQSPGFYAQQPSGISAGPDVPQQEYGTSFTTPWYQSTQEWSTTPSPPITSNFNQQAVSGNYNSQPTTESSTISQNSYRSSPGFGQTPVSVPLASGGQYSQQDISGVQSDTSFIDSEVSAQQNVANFPPEEYNAAAYIDEPAKYDVKWTVQDDYGNDFGQRESRNEDITQGEYHVRLPDSRKQKVIYSVRGDSGFLAEVVYEEDESDGLNSNTITRDDAGFSQSQTPTNYDDSRSSQSLISDNFSQQASKENVFFQPRDQTGSYQSGRFPDSTGDVATSIKSTAQRALGNSIDSQQDYSRPPQLSYNNQDSNSVDTGSSEDLFANFQASSSTPYPLLQSQPNKASNFEINSIEFNSDKSQNQQTPQTYQQNNVQDIRSPVNIDNQLQISQTNQLQNYENGGNTIFPQSQFNNGQRGVEFSASLSSPSNEALPTNFQPPNTVSNYQQTFGQRPEPSTSLSTGSDQSFGSNANSYGSQLFGQDEITTPSSLPTSTQRPQQSYSQVKTDFSNKLGSNSLQDSRESYQISNIPNQNSAGGGQNGPNSLSSSVLQDNLISNLNNQLPSIGSSYPQNSATQSNPQNNQLLQFTTQSVGSGGQRAQTSNLDQSYTTAIPSTNSFTGEFSSSNTANQQNIYQTNQPNNPSSANQQPSLPFFQRPSAVSSSRIKIDYGRWRPSQSYQQPSANQSPSPQTLQPVSGTTVGPPIQYRPAYSTQNVQQPTEPPARATAASKTTSQPSVNQPTGQTRAGGYGRLKNSSIYQQSPNQNQVNFFNNVADGSQNYSAPKASSIL